MSINRHTPNILKIEFIFEVRPLSLDFIKRRVHYKNKEQFLKYEEYSNIYNYRLFNKALIDRTN